MVEKVLCARALVRVYGQTLLYEVFELKGALVGVREALWRMVLYHKHGSHGMDMRKWGLPFS